MDTATETTAAAPAYDTSSCVIRVTDFNQKTTDPNRRLWFAGQMRHVIDALAGAPVAVTVDTVTGHTEIGVTLEGLTSTFDGGYPAVMIRRPSGDRCSFALSKLGETILPLVDPITAGGGAKWRALRAYGDEKSAAIQTARAEHGETAGREYGCWEATLERQGAHVRYTPSKNPPAGTSAGTSWSGHVQDGKVTSFRVSHRPPR